MPQHLLRSKSLLHSELQPPTSCLVYTSPALADAMVASVSANHGTWLEPSCGTGAFIAAIARSGVKKSRIFGIDLNDKISDADELAQVSRGTEFLQWAAQRRKKFDFVVGNPPYVRSTELPAPIRDRIALTRLPNGSCLSRTANLWAAFLAHAMRLVKEGGAMAFVLPAAWEYADYASELREQICASFGEVIVHRCVVPLFEAIHDGSVVLIAKNRGSGPAKLVRRLHRSVQKLIEALDNPSVAPLPDVLSRSIQRADCAVRLGELLEIAIGAVTGDASYFLFSEAERRDRMLPIEACRSVISRTSDIKQWAITPEVWNDLLAQGARVWLFRPPGALCDNVAVKRYLELNASAGGCTRAAYKVKNRTPWYEVRLPAEPELFISGQSSVGPWFSINRCPQLTATNTLYVGRFRAKQSVTSMAAWGLALLSSRVFEQWKQRARIYPDGLHKMEPSDLKNLMIPRPGAIKGALKAYRVAVELLHGKKPELARSYADSWLLQSHDALKIQGPNS